MEEQRIVPCKYYFKEGYCVKGKYCLFSHDAEWKGEKKAAKIVCKFFQSERGCQRGKACTFFHPVPTASQPSLPRAAVSLDLTLEDSDCQVKESGFDPASVWDFRDNSSNNDGEYFYGACSSGEKSTKKYADLFAGSKGMVPKTANVNAMFKKAPYQTGQKICSFYIAGNCRFGKGCRDKHVLSSELSYENQLDNNNNNKMKEILESEIEEAKKAECGICLEQIGSSSSSGAGNLGMLSNCECTFCLDCIRNWRKNLVTSTTKADVKIPKSTPHFRLCPLCRRESFFVVPCMRLIKDPERKRLVVEEYKKSLSEITCKNYYETGSCPFGSSCFYRHISPSGELEKTTAPRHLINISEGSAEYYNPTMLASFVPPLDKK